MPGSDADAGGNAHIAELASQDGWWIGERPFQDASPRAQTVVRASDLDWQYANPGWLMKLERSDVEFPIWRKKVDKALFEHSGTRAGQNESGKYCLLEMHDSLAPQPEQGPNHRVSSMPQYGASSHAIHRQTSRHCAYSDLRF